MRSTFIFLGLLLPLSLATAGELKVHGYGTVGAVHAFQAGAEFTRDLAQPEGVKEGDTSVKVDSRFGIQLDYVHSPDLSFTAQAISKLQPEGSFEPTLSWAFVKYQFGDGFEIKAGRSKLDFIFQSEIVNLGFSSMTARPAPGYYSLPLFSMNGIDLDYSTPFKDGYLTSSLTLGVASSDGIPAYDTVFDAGGSPMLGGSINYETMDWSVKLSYGQVTPNMTPSVVSGLVQVLGPINPELAESIETKDKRIQYYSLGGEYNKGQWRSTAGLGYYSSKSRVFPDNSVGFFQLGYKLNNLTPFISFSKIKTHVESIKVETGTYLDYIADAFQRSFQADQTGYALGVRYDLTNNIALKAQYDLIKSDPEKSFLTATNGEEKQHGTIELFTIVLDYYF